MEILSRRGDGDPAGDRGARHLDAEADAQGDDLVPERRFPQELPALRHHAGVEPADRLPRRDRGGLPASTSRTCPLLVHLPPPSGAFPVRFDRYSPYFTRAAEYGLELVPLDFYPPGLSVRDGERCATWPTTSPTASTPTTWTSSSPGRGAAGAVAPGTALGRGGRRPAGALLRAPREGRTVRDSRSGSLVVHDVGEGGRRLMAQLAAPTTLTELAKIEFDPPLEATRPRWPGCARSACCSRRGTG